MRIASSDSKSILGGSRSTAVLRSIRVTQQSQCIYGEVSKVPGVSAVTVPHGLLKWNFKVLNLLSHQILSSVSSLRIDFKRAVSLC